MEHVLEGLYYTLKIRFNDFYLQFTPIILAHTELRKLIELYSGSS